jgi:hypothetical protein
MNKYIIRIPYSVVRYGDKVIHIFAKDSSSAKRKVKDCNNWHDEIFECNPDLDTNEEYEYSEMKVILEQENVSAPVGKSDSDPQLNSPNKLLDESKTNIT